MWFIASIMFLLPKPELIWQTNDPTNNFEHHLHRHEKQHPKNNIYTFCYFCSQVKERDKSWCKLNWRIFILLFTAIIIHYYSLLSLLQLMNFLSRFLLHTIINFSRSSEQFIFNHSDECVCTFSSKEVKFTMVNEKTWNWEK